MNKNLLLLAYDTENTDTTHYKPNTENRTTEHGFAWWCAADCVDNVPPGPNGVNWHPYIQARHWINKDFLRFENKTFMAGNSKGFWKEYGKSLMYDVRDGPAPFDTLLEEIVAKYEAQKLTPRMLGSETKARKAESYSPLTSRKTSNAGSKKSSYGAQSSKQVPPAMKNVGTGKYIMEGSGSARNGKNTRDKVSAKDGQSVRGKTKSRSDFPKLGDPSIKGILPIRGGRANRDKTSNGDAPSASVNPADSDDVTISASTTTSYNTTLTTNGVTISAKSETSTKAGFSWAQVARGQDKPK